MTHCDKIGVKVRAMREASGHTGQFRFWQMIDPSIQRSHCSAWESDKIKLDIPDKHWEKICRFFDVTLDFLLKSPIEGPEMKEFLDRVNRENKAAVEAIEAIEKIVRKAPLSRDEHAEIEDNFSKVRDFIALPDPQ